MKKLFAFAAVTLMFAATSCKKDYTCSVGSGDTTVSVTYTGLTKSEASDLETQCEAGGGTWAAK